MPIHPSIIMLTHISVRVGILAMPIHLIIMVLAYVPVRGDIRALLFCMTIMMHACMPVRAYMGSTYSYEYCNAYTCISRMWNKSCQHSYEYHNAYMFINKRSIWDMLILMSIMMHIYLFMKHQKYDWHMYTIQNTWGLVPSESALEQVRFKIAISALNHNYTRLGYHFPWCLNMDCCVAINCAMVDRILDMSHALGPQRALLRRRMHAHTNISHGMA